MTLIIGICLGNAYFFTIKIMYKLSNLKHLCAFEIETISWLCEGVYFFLFGKCCSFVLFPFHIISVFEHY